MLLLKNRIVLYNSVHKEIDYLKGDYSNKWGRFIKVKTKDDPTLYIRVPAKVQTPRDIEMYCKGLEVGYALNNLIIEIERKDMRVW